MFHNINFYCILKSNKCSLYEHKRLLSKTLGTLTDPKPLKGLYIEIFILVLSFSQLGAVRRSGIVNWFPDKELVMCLALFLLT